MITLFMNSVADFWTLSKDLFLTFIGFEKSPAVVEQSPDEDHCQVESARQPERTGILTEIQRRVLDHWLQCPTLPHRLITRCQILVVLDDGKPKHQIAREQNRDIKTIRKWNKRWQVLNRELSPLETTSIKHKDYCKRIMEALSDATRCGHPIVFSAEQVVQLIALACEVRDGSDESNSHWTRSELAREMTQQGTVDKISRTSVGRFLSEAKIKPHKSRYWLNADPEDPEEFQQQIRVICCLYEEAPVLHRQGIHLISTDEKTGIQALQRLHPTRPAIPRACAR